MIAIYVVKIFKRNYRFPVKAPIKSHRYDCLQNKSNSMAGAIQVDTICKDSLLIDSSVGQSIESLFRVFLLFDLLILANVISFTAMVYQGRYLRGAPRED